MYNRIIKANDPTLTDAYNAYLGYKGLTDNEGPGSSVEQQSDFQHHPPRATVLAFNVTRQGLNLINNPISEEITSSSSFGNLVDGECCCWWNTVWIPEVGFLVMIMF